MGQVYATDLAGVRPLRLALLTMARKNGKSKRVAAAIQAMPAMAT